MTMPKYPAAPCKRGCERPLRVLGHRRWQCAACGTIYTTTDGWDRVPLTLGAKLRG